jgi:hypothetical protein
MIKNILATIGLILGVLLSIFIYVIVSGMDAMEHANTGKHIWDYGFNYSLNGGK